MNDNDYYAPRTERPQRFALWALGVCLAFSFVAWLVGG